MFKIYPCRLFLYSECYISQICSTIYPSIAKVNICFYPFSHILKGNPNRSELIHLWIIGWRIVIARPHYFLWNLTFFRKPNGKKWIWFYFQDHPQKCHFLWTYKALVIIDPIIFIYIELLSHSSLSLKACCTNSLSKCHKCISYLQ